MAGCLSYISKIQTYTYTIDDEKPMGALDSVLKTSIICNENHTKLCGENTIMVILAMTKGAYP